MGGETWRSECSCGILLSSASLDPGVFHGSVLFCSTHWPLCSDLTPREMSAVVPETTPHTFVSQTRAEKFPDKGVSLEDESCLFSMTPQSLLCVLLMRMISPDTQSSHRPSDGASLLGVSGL